MCWERLADGAVSFALHRSTAAYSTLRSHGVCSAHHKGRRHACFILSSISWPRRGDQTNRYKNVHVLRTPCWWSCLIYAAQIDSGQLHAWLTTTCFSFPFSIFSHHDGQYNQTGVLRITLHLEFQAIELTFCSAVIDSVNNLTLSHNMFAHYLFPQASLLDSYMFNRFAAMNTANKQVNTTVLWWSSLISTAQFTPDRFNTSLTACMRRKYSAFCILTTAETPSLILCHFI
jgi:hypothetical protein